MKLPKFGKKKSPESASNKVERVTYSEVDQHRDEILSRGRRYKYPFIRNNRKVAMTSIIIVLAALFLVGLTTGLRLYFFQDRGELTYRITKFLPFPVAQVNGKLTAYESYLFELRSSLFWQSKYGTTDLKSPDGLRQVDYLKRQALDKAMVNTIAQNLAKDNKITISDDEINLRVGKIKAFGGNLEQILNDQYSLSEADLRRAIHDSLLRAQVAKKLDKDAPNRAQAILDELKQGKDFAEVAKEKSEDIETKLLGGDMGVVEKGHANLPSEVSDKIFQLQPGESSQVIEAGADYYIIKVTEKVDDTRYRVSAIRIKSKDMYQYLKDYRDRKKIREFIKIPVVDSKDASF